MLEYENVDGPAGKPVTRQSERGEFLRHPFTGVALAMECGVPVVPMTIVGTHYAMPKGRYAIKPAKVRVIFHDPIHPKDFGTRECLMEKVRVTIESGLPAEYRHAEDASMQMGKPTD